MRTLIKRKGSKSDILKSTILCAALALTFFGAGALRTNTALGTDVFSMGNVLASGAPSTSTGIVPCGRETDNPNTPNNETDTCTFCHLALIANNFILFLFSIASATALLAFMIAALLYIFAGANPVNKNNAREAVINIVKGYVVIFTAWLIVDFFLSAWGFISPLGGQWNVICLFSGLF